eukprot:TRINITY_DN5004_c0_g1_i1.p1 TRINITY_DN5004_c0_g1~~TRINITY_DN5004_c0_g1_i1.p1  ORF type:complete len:168 (+),score=15.74 TRINITY_DN5004_c0_g1_i1:135-638(+)
MTITNFIRNAIFVSAFFSASHALLCSDVPCPSKFECCPDQRSGPACFDPQEYRCTLNNLGQQVLCPTGYMSCGESCYSPSTYCCLDGTLEQLAKCPAKTTAIPEVPASSSAECHKCNGECYDSATHDCTINDKGSEVLCPSKHESCGDACYSSSQYCCKEGIISNVC